MNTTTPYFYILRHKPTQKLYAGCKYGTTNKGTDSLNLMTRDGYHTSSKVVRTIIKNEGLDAFEIIRIRHFDTADAAIEYERRFLKKVNAKMNDNFLNMSNNDGGSAWSNKGGYELSEDTKRKMRKPKSEETRKRMSEQLKNKPKEYWKEQAIKRIGMKHTNQGLENMGKAQRARFQNESERVKISESVQEFYRNGGLSPEQRAKHKLAVAGENNGMYGKTHSEESRQKMKDAWARRKERKNGSDK